MSCLLNKPERILLWPDFHSDGFTVAEGRQTLRSTRPAEAVALISFSLLSLTNQESFFFFFKNSFIALPGKGGHSGLLHSESMCPNPGEFGEEFYGKGSRAGLLVRLGGVRGLYSFNLVSGDLFFFFLTLGLSIYLFIYGCVGSSFLCEGFL